MNQAGATTVEVDVSRKEKWAIVTGASRGIGRGIAMRLAHEGYSIVAVARDAEALGSLKREIDVLGLGAECHVLDLTDPEATEQFARKITEGRPNWPLEVLVNNAGGGLGDKEFLATNMDEWRRVLRLNTLAPYILVKVIGSYMVERGFGRIVNISSAAARYKVSLDVTSGAYVAAKAALLGLTRQAAVLVAEGGVTVNAVLPGDVLTGSSDEEAPPDENEDEALATLYSRVPRGTLTSVDEIAGAVAWLCSVEAAAVTGLSLDVNSGAWIGD